jgi:hypothetical protein
VFGIISPFRSARAVRVYPRRPAGKLPSGRVAVALAVALALAVAAAGCGGSGGGEQQVRGPAFSFEAPGDWKLSRDASGASARSSHAELVSVTVLPLRRPYDPKLFRRVVVELDHVAQQLADELKGSVDASRTLTVGGRRVRQYDVVHQGIVDRFTFVLRGRSNFQLLCRFTGDEPEACRTLIATFRTE